MPTKSRANRLAETEAKAAERGRIAENSKSAKAAKSTTPKVKPGDLWASIHGQGEYGAEPHRKDRLWRDVLFARVFAPALPSFPPADEATRLADQMATHRETPAYRLARLLGTSPTVVQSWLDGTSRPPGKGEASDLQSDYEGITGLLRLFGALKALALAGGPPPVAPPVQEPEPEEARVLGGEGFPSAEFLTYFGLDEDTAHEGVTVVGRLKVLKGIVAGKVPMLVPTLHQKPTPEQARRLRESVPGLRPADVAALLEWPPYPAFERGDVGFNVENVAGALRLFGCLAAYQGRTGGTPSVR